MFYRKREGEIEVLKVQYPSNETYDFGFLVFYFFGRFEMHAFRNCDSERKKLETISRLFRSIIHD